MAKLSKPKRNRIIRYALIVIVLLALGYWYQSSRNSDTKEIIRTAKVTRGDVVDSVSATGVLRPVTTVEVKSNVGGQIVELLVDEGDSVKAGQIIAKIDPADSLANLQQTLADQRSSQSKVAQTRESLGMQSKQTPAAIASAKQAVESARQRMLQAQKEAKIQPTLTSASIKEAQSSLESAQAALGQTKNATIPQALASAKASYNQSKATFDQLKNDLARKKSLLEKGFISNSQMDSAQQQFDVAQAQLEDAKSRVDTIKDETDQMLSAAQARVRQAQASLDTAKAGDVKNGLKQQDYLAAQAAYKQAVASLENAKAGSYQVPMKRQEIIQAQAQLQRSSAAVKDAQTQLGYTTILAPSSGVVVKKYAEKGSIITGGRSSFSGSGSGVAIVDIADTTQMTAVVNIDETDIAQVRVGQQVDITVDALPGEKFDGRVTKIAPQAVMDQNVTTIPVTVTMAETDERLKPEMNATCEFIVSRKSNVLLVPSSAVKNNKQGATVTVIDQGNQEKRKVKIGLETVDQVEILEGLREGETVVTAIINTGPTAGRQGSGGGSGGRPSGGSMRRPGPF